MLIIIIDENNLVDFLMSTEYFLHFQNFTHMGSFNGS